MCVCVCVCVCVGRSVSQQLSDHYNKMVSTSHHPCTADYAFVGYRPLQDAKRQFDNPLYYMLHGAVTTAVIGTLHELLFSTILHMEGIHTICPYYILTTNCLLPRSSLSSVRGYIP